MKFHLIDYSSVYFPSQLAKAIPLRRGGKFIQLRKNPIEYLLLSPKGFSVYHANILEHFCSEKGICGIYNDKRDYFLIHEPDWNIIGGGMWSIDDNHKLLSLSGSSLSYGKFDRRGLREKLMTAKGLFDYDIRIG